MPDPLFPKTEIQKRVNVIRQARGGIAGDPAADWQAAIQQLEQERSTQKTRSRFSWLTRSLTRLEKDAIEPAANRLDKADIFRIIEKISPIIEAIGVIAIPVAIWWFSETSQEAKEQQEKAIRAQTAVQNYLNQLSDILTTGKLKTDEDLQTIVRASTLALLDNPDLQPDPELDDGENWRNDRKGQTIGYLAETGLVQVEAPESSQNSKQADEPKEPVISLAKANLSNANLSNANLSGATLSFANLSGADLSLADLHVADLRVADLRGAYLSSADLRVADLRGADLSNAGLNFADLSSADLRVADLSSADLRVADLRVADLSSADLRVADLHDADLSNANLHDADLSTVRNWTEEQLGEAKLCNTRLPAGANLDANRDCEELGISPE